MRIAALIIASIIFGGFFAIVLGQFFGVGADADPSDDLGQKGADLQGFPAPVPADDFCGWVYEPGAVRDSSFHDKETTR